MTKKKSTKRAFISSLISLALCVTMLVGTTFAWYTDSVTSGRNTIVAGSLDMVIERYNGNASDAAFADNWQNVDGTTKIFNETDGKLTFEPGAVQVAYVRVKNNGDLAFKYSLAAKVFEETAGTNQAGASFLLSDYLKFGTATTDAPYTSREAAINAVKNGATKLQDAQLANGAVLEKGAAPVIVALVIYMPEDVGNDANPQPDKKPTISFGLNALATQATIENDSFSNTYDESAQYPDPVSATVSGTADTNGAITLYANATPDVDSGKQTSAEFPAGSFASGDEIILTVETNDVPPASAFSVDTNLATVATIDLTAMKNGVKVTEFNGNAVTVTTYIAKGLDPANVNVVYTETGAQPTDITYDSATGKLTFKTTHFSEYVVTAANVVAYDVESESFYATMADAFAQNSSIIILKNVALVNPGITIPAVQTNTLDLNGYLVSTVDDTASWKSVITNRGTLTIKDSVGKGEMTTSMLAPDGRQIPGYASNLFTNYGTLTIDGGKFTNTTTGGGACYVLDTYDGVATINNGYLLQPNSTCVRIAMFNSGHPTLNVKGGTIESGAYAVQPFECSVNSTCVLNISGGKIISTDTEYNLAMYAYSYNKRGDLITINISGGEFFGNVAFAGTVPAENINITGGLYHNDCYSYSDNVTGFIKGGTFPYEEWESGSTEDSFKASDYNMTLEQLIAWFESSGYTNITSDGNDTVVGTRSWPAGSSIDDFADRIAAGYRCVNNGDGTFTVVA